MSCICWNCRGLGIPRKVPVLKKEIILKGPEFVFLCETKLLCSELDRFARNVGMDNVFGVSCSVEGGGRSGGVAILWRADCDVRILSSSLNHIDLWVGSDTEG